MSLSCTPKRTAKLPRRSSSNPKTRQQVRPLSDSLINKINKIAVTVEEAAIGSFKDRRSLDNSTSLRSRDLDNVLSLHRQSDARSGPTRSSVSGASYQTPGDRPTPLDTPIQASRTISPYGSSVTSAHPLTTVQENGLDGAPGNLFELFRMHGGEEYTVYTRDDGKRFYVDWEEQVSVT